ncbi:MAG: hypothetical protein U0165_00915 [Polyangiaceae bacterium]
MITTQGLGESETQGATNDPKPVEVRAADLPEPAQLERALWEVIPTMALDAIKRVLKHLTRD